MHMVHFLWILPLEENMICPNCNSNQATVTPVVEKDKRGCFGTLLLIILAFIPVLGWIALFMILRGRKTTTRMYAACQNCGYTWTYKPGSERPRQSMNVRMESVTSGCQSGSDEPRQRVNAGREIAMPEACCVCMAPLSSAGPRRSISSGLPDQHICATCVKRLKEIRRLASSADPSYRDAVRRFAALLDEESLDEDVAAYLQGTLRKFRRIYRDACAAETEGTAAVSGRTPPQMRAADRNSGTAWSSVKDFLHKNRRMLLIVLASAAGVALLIAVPVLIMAARSAARGSVPAGVSAVDREADVYGALASDSDPYTDWDLATDPQPIVTPPLSMSVEDEVIATLNAYDTSLTVADALAYLNREIELLQTTYGSYDAELDSLLLDYRARYKQEVLEGAKTVFSTDGYVAAVSLIQSSFSLLDPEDADLVAALDYYNQYAPVYVADLDYFTYENDGISSPKSFTDNTGSEHAHAVKIRPGSSKPGSKSSETYLINAVYRTLTGIVCLPFDYRNRTEEYRFRVYGDSKLLYESSIITKGCMPEPFTCDVSGVSLLTIEGETIVSGASGCYFGVGELLLEP